MIDARLEQLLRYMLGLFLFVLPIQAVWIVQERFLNGIKWEYGTLAYYGTEVLLWAAVGLFIVWYVKSQPSSRAQVEGKSTFVPSSGRGKVKSQKFSWTKDRLFVATVLFFIIYSFTSILWAQEKQVAFQQAFHLLEAALLFFMLFVGPLSFRSAAAFFIGGATLQSILGLWQFLTQSTAAFAWLGLAAHPAYEAGASIISGEAIGRWLRAYGGFSHPNVFGGYLAISLFLTGLLFARTHTKKQSIRIAYHAALLIQAAALFVTFSRSAWIAAGIAATLFGIMAFRKKSVGRYVRGALPALVLIIIFSTLYAPVLQTRLMGESSHEVRSVTERVSGYEEATMLFQSHPFIGVGVGNYTAAAYALHPDRPGWEYQPVHNVPILLLVELGLIGVALAACMLSAFFKLLRTAGDRGQTRTWFLACIVLIPIYLVDHYLFSSYIGLIMGAVFFGLTTRYLVSLQND